MRFLRNTCCLLLLIFGSLNAYSQDVDLRKIESLLNNYSSKDSPGFAVGVVIDNVLVFTKGHGLANLDYNVPNSDSTAFSLASISKQFTASAIWSLIQDNKLNLEDDIKLYLSDFPDYAQPIKIKHLLNHSSGIRNYHALMQLSGFDYDNTYYNNNSVYDLVKRQRKLSDLPGNRMFYSNSNYTLLTLIIEKVSNQNLKDYLKEHILGPLGMHQTSVSISHDVPIKNKAIGYQQKEDAYHFNGSTQTSYGAGSMRSTIKDMGIWLKMINGAIPEFLNLSTFLKTQDLLNNGQKSTYARGLQVDDYRSYTTYSHSGFGFGNQSQMICIPEKNLGVVVLTNLQSINPNEIAYNVLDYLLPEKSTEEAIDPLELPIQNLEVFKGTYLEINSDLKMIFSVENDTLNVKGPYAEAWTKLIPFGANQFHREDSEEVKYFFVNDMDYGLKIEFGGTPFYFDKIILSPVADLKLTDFTGNYFSEELNVNYIIERSDTNLNVSFPNNKYILKQIDLDTFGNNNRTIFRFNRNDFGDVDSFEIGSEGQIGNIVFTKNNKP